MKTISPSQGLSSMGTWTAAALFQWCEWLDATLFIGPLGVGRGRFSKVGHPCQVSAPKVNFLEQGPTHTEEDPAWAGAGEEEKNWTLPRTDTPMLEVGAVSGGTRRRSLGPLSNCTSQRAAGPKKRRERTDAGAPLSSMINASGRIKTVQGPA